MGQLVKTLHFELCILIQYDLGFVDKDNRGHRSRCRDHHVSFKNILIKHRIGLFDLAGFKNFDTALDFSDFGQGTGCIGKPEKKNDQQEETHGDTFN